MINNIAEIRNRTALSLSVEKQQKWEQFLTPVSVAQQAASLFSDANKPVRILDLGSGTGILGAILAEQAVPGSSTTAVELDPELAAISQTSLKQVCGNVKVINSSVFDISFKEKFDRVILNPPYKKINPTVIKTDGAKVKVTNLYTAFLAIAIQFLAPGGECVAIIPRSWMNGEYFKDFRKWMLRECSLDAFAIYGSRQEHFKDMDILQEIMLLKVSKRKQTNKIVIYDDVSPSCPLREQKSVSESLSALTLGKDCILRIRRQDGRLNDFKTLSEQGLWVSTGKLVKFRNLDILSDKKISGGYPLYWSDNQRGLAVKHPVKCERSQWVTAAANERNLVLPSGSYCLVNRFSAKEQPRRINASYLASSEKFAADNKLNYIHEGTSRKTVPLDEGVAFGLTIWLSSGIVDEWYRQISGSTQVNAADLRRLPCPSKEQLAILADLSSSDCETNQTSIDQTVERLFSWTKVS